MDERGTSSDDDQSRTFGTWCLWVFRMSCILALLAAAISQVYLVASRALQEFDHIRAAAADVASRTDARSAGPSAHEWTVPPGCLKEIEGPALPDATKPDRPAGIQPDPPRSDNTRPAEGIDRRLVEIKIDDHQIVVNRTVWLGRCSHAMTRLRGVMSSNGFAEALSEERKASRANGLDIEDRPIMGIFGAVSAGVEEIHSAPIIEEEDQALALVKVSERSVMALGATDEERQKAYLLYVYFGHWPSGSNELTVKTSAQVSVWSGVALPFQQSAALGVWKLGDKDFVLVHVENPAKAAVKADAAVPAAPERPFLLRAMTGDVRAVWASWRGVMHAVPFFAFLWWARRRATVEAKEAAILQAVIKGCRIALSLIAVLAACDVVDILGGVFQGALGRYGFFNLYWTAELLKGAMVGIVWPLLAGYGPWVVRARRSTASAWVAAVAIAAATGATDYLARQPNTHGDLLKVARMLQHDVLPQQDLSRLISGAAVLIFSMILAPLAALWGTGKAWTGRPVTSALLLGLAWLALDGLSRGEAGGLQVFAGAALAVPFGWAFAKATRAWLPWDPPWATRTTLAWVTALLVVLAVILALPPDTRVNWSFPSLLSGSAWELARTWQWAGMALLLAWLAPREGVSPATAGHREAGVVLLFVGFFWQPAPVFQLLASAAAGALALYAALYAPRTLRRPRGLRRRLLGRAIEDIRLYNRLLRLRRGLQKGIQAKVDKAEIESMDAIAKLDQMDREVEVRERAANRQRCVALLALNAGPGGSAWERGKQGALVASLVALPWVAWYFRAIKMGDGDTGAFAFQIFALGFADVARWPLLGFFFMYFYPQLRGNSGIQKGIWMTAILVVPAAVGTLVGAPTLEGWSAVALWALQAFVVCMLLGVVLGDFGALRLGGRRAKGLIEIYNLGTLVAWTSSLALAVGVATTTSIAEQAAGFVKDRIEQVMAPPAKTEEAGAGGRSAK